MACAAATPNPNAASTTTTTADDSETTSATATSTSAASKSPSSSSSAGASGSDEPNAAIGGLTLDDFFNPATAWEERRYDIADQKAVPGIAAQLRGCQIPQELELRLGNNFEELEFSVAQANDSTDSDSSVSVEVLANNAQIEIRSVPFNEIQSFSIPVTGVNALKIVMSVENPLTNCGGSVIGVITDATLN